MQKHFIPYSGIKNIRTDSRISFCGGKNSITTLERLVITGQAKVAFASTLHL